MYIYLFFPQQFHPSCFINKASRLHSVSLTYCIRRVQLHVKFHKGKRVARTEHYVQYRRISLSESIILEARCCYASRHRLLLDIHNVLLPQVWRSQNSGMKTYTLASVLNVEGDLQSVRQKERIMIEQQYNRQIKPAAIYTVKWLHNV